MTSPVLALSGVSRRFGDFLALDRVDLTCERGEIHAVLGENGAGKSTLMHVVSGLLRADEGEIRMQERLVRWRSADEARSAGITMVHQHFMLVPTMTVAENVALARRALGWLNRTALDADVRALARERGIDIGDPGRRIEELSVGEQQRVEILKALVDVPALLILDEPTAVLTPVEVEDLFVMLRKLATRGAAIVIVTHRLAEVFAIADRVSVLRRGRLVGSGLASRHDRMSLARLMVGEQPPSRPVRRRSRATADVRLELRGVGATRADGRSVLEGIDLSVRSGEVVVVAGVEGNGQQELQDAVCGIHAGGFSGEVWLRGRSVRSPRDVREWGLAVVPGDRRVDGLVGALALWENLLLAADALRRAAPRGFLSPSAEIERGADLLGAYAVRPCRPTLPAAALSGGNQQRLVLARELSRAGVEVVLAANPTRGLDLVATDAIHRRLRGLAEGGVAVLVLSTDLDEVEALADRVVVLYRGRLQTPRSGGVDRVEIGRLMAGIGDAA